MKRLKFLKGILAGALAPLMLKVVLPKEGKKIPIFWDTQYMSEPFKLAPHYLIVRSDQLEIAKKLLS